MVILQPQSVVELKDLKLHLLRTVCILILICAVAICLSFVLYWVGIVFFNSEYDILELSLVFIIFILLISIPFLVPETLTERGEEKLRNWFVSKRQHYELNTRYVLRNFFIRLGTIIAISTMLVMLLIQATLPEGEQSPLYPLIPFFSGIFLFILGRSIISDYGVSFIHFKKFRSGKWKIFKDLERGLKNYNRAVGFGFQAKKLYSITQYARHVYSLGLREEIYPLETGLDKIIQAFENRNLGEIPKTLAELAKNSDSFVEKYGIEFKPSFRTRTKETITSSFHKALPQLIWLLISIGIFLLLSPFIPIEISFP